MGPVCPNNHGSAECLVKKGFPVCGKKDHPHHIIFLQLLELVVITLMMSLHLSRRATSNRRLTTK